MQPSVADKSSIHPRHTATHNSRSVYNVQIILCVIPIYLHLSYSRDGYIQ